MIYHPTNPGRHLNIKTPSYQYRDSHVNTLRPRQNGRHFADDIFKWIFLNKNLWIPIKISLTFVPQGPINNIPALVQIMAWHRPGDKPLSEAMMFRLLTHICVGQPQWVKDVTVCRPSYLEHGNIHTLRTVFILRRGPGQGQGKDER